MCLLISLCYYAHYRFLLYVCLCLSVCTGAAQTSARACTKSPMVGQTDTHRHRTNTQGTSLRTSWTCVCIHVVVFEVVSCCFPFSIPFVVSSAISLYCLFAFVLPCMFFIHSFISQTASSDGLTIELPVFEHTVLFHECDSVQRTGGSVFNAYVYLSLSLCVCVCVCVCVSVYLSSTRMCICPLSLSFSPFVSTQTHTHTHSE